MKHTITTPITQDNLPALMQDLVEGDEVILLSLKLLGKNVTHALRNYSSLRTKARVYTAEGFRVDRKFIKRELKEPEPVLYSMKDMEWIPPFTEPRFDYMNDL